jgi:threonine/homoserine/homoserine lactone efflux protein
VARVLLGYIAHAILSAIGVATLVSALPWLFELLRWFGVAYLVFLALQMPKSACTPGAGVYACASKSISLWRGFLTSFLNPKGLLVYFAVQPQFIDPGVNVTFQVFLLSGLFIVGCSIVYGAIGLISSKASVYGFSDRARRQVEGVASALLSVAAARIAIAVGHTHYSSITRYINWTIRRGKLRVCVPAVRVLLFCCFQ